MLTSQDSHLHHHHGHHMALTVYLQTDKKENHHCINGARNTHIREEVSNLKSNRHKLVKCPSLAHYLIM